MPEQPNQPNTRLDTQSDDVENASLDSFPASNAPKWGSLRLGPPIHSELAPSSISRRSCATVRSRFVMTSTIATISSCAPSGTVRALDKDRYKDYR